MDRSMETLSFMSIAPITRIASGSANNLSDLPDDIHMTVASHLDALSVVALATTNKTFYELLAKSRAVWKSVVELQASRDGLAPFSIATNSMTMEDLVQQSARRFLLQSDLRKASARHFTRLEHEPSNEGIDAIPLERTPRFGFGLADTDGRGKLPHFTKLLPGGRWLVGCVESQGFVRTLCWDIWSFNHGKVSTPAASIDSRHRLAPDATSWGEMVVAQPCDGCTRVAVLVPYEISENRTALEIVLLSWLPDSTPQFELSGSLLLEFPLGELQFSLDGGVVLIQQGPSARLWEWTNGSDEVMESPLPDGTIRAILRVPFVLTILRSLPEVAFYRIEKSTITKAGEFSLALDHSAGRRRVDDCETLDTWTPPSPDRISYLDVVENGASRPKGRRTFLIPPITRWASLTSLHAFNSWTSTYREYQPLPDGLGLIGGWNKMLWATPLGISNVTGSALLYDSASGSGFTIMASSKLQGNTERRPAMTLVKSVQVCMYSGLMIIQIRRTTMSTENLGGPFRAYQLL